MREDLIKLIKVLQASAVHHRQQVKLEGGNSVQLWFGYGYYSQDKVIFSPSGKWQPIELTVEDGVESFLKETGLCDTERG